MLSLFRPLSLLLLMAASTAQDYIVAPDGDDARDGLMPATAWKTVQHAADAALPGDTVRIRAGVYRESIRPAHSGTEGAPIVFEGYAGEFPTISGLDPVVGWTHDEGPRWHAPMPNGYFHSAINQADQIFIDGVMVEEARWPDLGPDRSHPKTGTVTRFVSKQRIGPTTTGVIEDDHLPLAPDNAFAGAQIQVQPNSSGWGWTFTGVVVASRQHTLTFRSTNDCGIDGKPEEYAIGARYHLFAHDRLMDAEGEWVHDLTHGILHLWSARDLTKTLVEAKRRDFAFDLSERSWITVRSLRLFGCSLTSDRDAGGDGVPVEADGSARYPWRPSGWAAPASHLVVDGIDASYINHFTDLRGHFSLQWGHQTGLVIAGSDNLVRNCVITWAAGNGISLQGRRSRCIGNTIRDVAYVPVDCAAIQTGPQTVAEDFEIAWNTIERCGRSGILLRSLRNSDPHNLVTRIHHNDVADWLAQDWDGGAFYLFGMDGRFTRIDHNRFHCREPRSGMVFGIYFDFSKNYIVDHNLVWGIPTPIQVTHAFDNDKAKVNNLLIYRNTAVSNNAAWGSPMNGSPQNNGSVIHDNIFSVCAFTKPDGGSENGWPSYGEGSVSVSGNLVYGGHEHAYWTKEKRLKKEDRWSPGPGFANAAKDDFSLAADSAAVDAGSPFPLLERDGITVPPFEDPVVGSGLDVGALERGAPAFLAGASAAPR